MAPRLFYCHDFGQNRRFQDDRYSTQACTAELEHVKSAFDADPLASSLLPNEKDEVHRFLQSAISFSADTGALCHIEIAEGIKLVCIRIFQKAFVPHENGVKHLQTMMEISPPYIKIENDNDIVLFFYLDYEHMVLTLC